MTSGRTFLASLPIDSAMPRYHRVEYADHTVLVPIDEEPLEAARDEIRDALEGTSREELRRDALERARSQIQNEFED